MVSAKWSNLDQTKWLQKRLNYLEIYIIVVSDPLNQLVFENKNRLTVFSKIDLVMQSLVFRNETDMRFIFCHMFYFVYIKFARSKYVRDIP